MRRRRHNLPGEAQNRDSGHRERSGASPRSPTFAETRHRDHDGERKHEWIEKEQVFVPVREGVIRKEQED